MRSKILTCFFIVWISFTLLKFNVNADGPEFVIEEENVEITVLKDSSLDIWYFLTIETILGPQRGIYFGIPKEDIPDYSVTSGNTMLDVEKQGTKLKIYFPAIANSGDVTRLKIHLIVPEMVYKDKEGRVGVEFYPAWWDYQRVDVLRVKFIAPEGVTIDELRCYPASADNFAEESGRAFAYWERSLSEGERFRCGISFMITSHVNSKSIPKYSWIRMSLIPAIFFQGISGYLSFTSLGIFLTASPIISIRRMTES